MSMITRPNHALHLTRPLRSGCNPRAPRAGSLFATRPHQSPRFGTVIQRARHKVRIGFWEYARAGIPLTVLTIAIGVLLLRLIQFN